MKEKCFLAGRILLVTVLIAYLFYDSAWALFAGFLVGPLYVAAFYKDQQQKATFDMEKQFCTGLLFAAGVLESGYSLENAWKEMQEEVAELFGSDTAYCKMLRGINQGISVNQPLERLVLDAYRQTDSEIMKDFADVLYFARKSGGNLTRIMRGTANRILHKYQISEELQMAISAKKLELLVMNIMPFAILAYLRFSLTAFVASLYHNVRGCLVMTICLALYFAAWMLARRIVRIGV